MITMMVVDNYRRIVLLRMDADAFATSIWNYNKLVLN